MTASRRGFAPQVMAYWLMSAEMAWRAASLISSGAAKSGKPCERLTALCFSARRVISRMTDSVNCSALAEIMRREMCAMEDSVATRHLKQVEERKNKMVDAYLRALWAVPPAAAVVAGVGALVP